MKTGYGSEISFTAIFYQRTRSALARALSEAYRMDEAVATSRKVQRIVEKVRLRLSPTPPIRRHHRP